MSDTVETPQAAATPSVTHEPSDKGGRYSLNDAGEILFQPDATNPLPGQAVGHVMKGEALLQPVTEYLPAQDWLTIHVRSVLEPLFLLKQEAGEGVLPEGAAREIGARLYEHLGVMHRSDLEDLIPQLDADTRKTLRAKGVRLGPILAFLPALVKPAAVKMRALLWGVWNGKALPVVRPADGRVSEVVDPATVDRHFYRMIGYPVFGPRAIRIDMLDRVITDVYDTANQGVFDAKHKYAEWLGTNLDGLHAILEAMGHRRLKETAAESPDKETPDKDNPDKDNPDTGRPDEQPVPEGPDEKPQEQPAENPVPPAQPEDPVPAPQPEQTPTGPAEMPAPDGPTEVPLGQPGAASMTGAVSGAVSGAVEAVVAAPAKVLPATVKFMLKRGKMSDRPQARHGGRSNGKPGGKAGGKPERRFTPKKAFDPNVNVPQLLTEEDKARIAAREKARDEARARGRSEGGRSDGGRSEGGRRRDEGGEDRPRKPKFDRKRGERDDDREGRIYTFESAKKADDDDGNPFAILKKLK